MVTWASVTLLHTRGPSHCRYDLVGERVSNGALGCQALGVQPRQVSVVQALAGEAAGGELLGECLCPQRELLPRQFLCLSQVPRPLFAKEGRDPAATPDILPVPVPGEAGRMR